MVRITEELVRKKSEHNEGLIGSLEELSLHQEDVEKIEHLNNWCKELQILYLQANLISKIENLNKLKKLEYLNLAINNIEKIENLERCESLAKLDLTLNFIGDLESVKSLVDNINLKDLYLTGNPCCEYEGYRDYVIATLPQLRSLDQKDITKSERIRAQQVLPEVEKKIKKCQEEYRWFREAQKKRHRHSNSEHLTDEEFWKTVSDHSPETRVEIANRHRKKGNVDVDEEIQENKSVRLFTKDGRPLNLNQAKLKFTFSDADPEQFVLDVAVYKYLDTNLIDVDLQPIYVKLTIKGKIFQIVFPEEVHVEKSEAKRSQTTGHLVLNLPRVNYKPTLIGNTNSPKNAFTKNLNENKISNKKNTERLEEECKDKHKNDSGDFKKVKHEYLEIGENTNNKTDIDFSKIVKNNEENFKNSDMLDLDNSEVPPLEYAYNMLI